MSNQRQSNVSIQHNLNRVGGQVQGIVKMIDEERNCLEIVQQIVAARNALSGVARELLSSEAGVCAKDPNKSTDFNKVLKSLFEIS